MASSFSRALTLARYNWPLYVFATLVAIVGIALCLAATSTTIRLLGGVAALVAVWFATASFLAFHAMFDRSSLLRGTWLPELLEKAPEKWVQISVCLEETTLPMNQLFPAAEGVLLDIFSPSVMTEPAVTRARARSQNDHAVAVTPASLGVADEWADATVIMLAAHEVRNAAMRESLFRELSRITAAGGRIVVVEHLRNFAAFLAFGPGFFHFLPRSEWIRLSTQSGMRLISESSITPFVHVFVFKPHTAARQRG
jgi:hypothetical protein